MATDKLEYLIAANEELRNELKLRISQRDNFAIQFIVILGVLSGISLTDGNHFIFLLMPIICLYFGIQILSSYAVHDRLVYFIREHIELEIAKELDTTSEVFWEKYCKKDRELHNVKLPGSRKKFFIRVMLGMPFLSAALYFYFQSGISIKVIGVSFLYFLAAIYIIYRFEYYPEIVKKNILSKVDYKRLGWKPKRKQKALFLDRDGTIHVDKVMTRRKEDLEFFDDAFQTLHRFQKKGYKLIIITNQSGIAKGIYTKREMHQFNAHMRKELKKHDIKIDAIYYCPHFTNGDCLCSKPRTGMIERGKIEFNLDLKNSILVGDKMTDIEAGKNAGIGRNYIVTTGIYPKNDWRQEEGIFNQGHEIISSLSELI